MEIEYFKSKLTKGQLEAMAIDAVKKQLENADEYQIYRFAKKLKFFSEHLVKESEEKLKDVWTESDRPEDMNYTTGDVILNLDEFEYRKFIAEHLKEVDEALKMAAKSKEPHFVVNIITGEVTSVPKVSIKSYRKDSINVKI